VHGFPVTLSSFIGRGGPVRAVAGLLEESRLVTVTGPGGSGKTRLADQVAGQTAARFADGAWLAELAAVSDPAQVAAAVAAALGIREQPGVPTAEALTRVLVRRQLLLVLDNCEHVTDAAAELCAGLLAACDDVRVLATSREPLQIPGEARYRLAPLTLPAPGDPADAGPCESVALYVDRARRADARFSLDEQTGRAVARLVTQLDGLPLAIELAAARVEAFGAPQLLDRIGDRFTLLAGGDRLAPGRQRSLAATVEWSYRLLDEDERRVFRQVSVFPGPFTLEGAEAVAGAEAGPAVLRLVDCSLLVAPRPGMDGRSRYAMLETLRAYGAELLARTGEQEQATAAMAGYALRVAEQAAAGLQTGTGEIAAALRLDAEDVMMSQVLAWAMRHDTAARAEAGSDQWCAAHYWLGLAAQNSADLAGALGHFTAVRDAVGDRARSPVLAECLSSRSLTLSNLGRPAEAAGDAHRALALAREIRYPAAEALALVAQAIAALCAEDFGGAVLLARQAGQISADVPGSLARRCTRILTDALTESGDLAAAEGICAAGLARSREAGDLSNQVRLLTKMATLDLLAGRVENAAAHLREELQINARAGDRGDMLGVLNCCGFLCAATRRAADAVTVWAAYEALSLQHGFRGATPFAHQQQTVLREARQALGPARARAAEERGTMMNWATAAEYALMLTAAPGRPQAPPEGGNLSARERELVTLVAQGRTNAQIAAQLYISIRTVSSHLDRIRDKTGCRRRADLTRLALGAGLV